MILTKIIKSEKRIVMNEINKITKILCLVLLLTAAHSLYAFSATGKIKGKVIDKETGEVLIGANVSLVGTTIGAAAQVDGTYLITNVPVGTYTLKASYMGYNSVSYNEVEVNINRTTIINFELSSQTITSQEVVVTAERQAVNVEVASSAKLITKKDIENLPTLTNVEELVGLQTGVVTIGEEIHIRGGQSDEVLYLIDGVPAKNPVTGVNALSIDINQIENVEILTGGFDAEYGNAQSGVINIITKSGRDRYSLEAVLKSDEPFAQKHTTNYDYAYIGLSGPMQLFDLIGMPGKGSFNLSVKTELNDTRYKIGGGYGSTDLGLFEMDNRQRSLYNVSGSVDYKPTKNIRLKLSYYYDKNFSKSFNWAWKNIPEYLPVSDWKSQQAQLILTHTIGENMFYQVSMSYSKHESQTSLRGMNSPLESFNYETTYYDTLGNPISRELIENILKNDPGFVDFSKTNSKYQRPDIGIDKDNDGFIDLGQDQNFYKESSDVFNLKFDITKFIEGHKLKAGFNIQGKKIDKLDILNYGYYFAGRDTIPGAYPEYGDSRWYFNDNPWEGSVYIQDNIEYAGMFLNIGVRGDFYVHGDRINDEDFIKQYNLATGENVEEFDKFKFELSPRIGLSIPASENTKLFFNYGYFTQLPTLEQLYRDPFLSSRVGNPDLKPKKSITYEVGMESEFMTDWVLLMKLYGRDFGGSINTRNTETKPIRKLYDNTGFGSSRGFEVELRKVYKRYWAFTANYTYLMARGFDLSDLQYYRLGSSITPPPVREQRVGWDINHNLNVIFNFNVSQFDEYDLFGIKLKDFGVSVINRFTSGSPYTALIPGSLYVESNSSTGPYYYNVDATINKGFTFGKTRVTFFLEAKNLLDISNVNIGGGFNTRTGEVINLGDLDGATNKYLTYHSVMFRRANATYYPGLSLRMGLKLFIK